MPKTVDLRTEIPGPKSRAILERNAIPAAYLRTPPGDGAAWLAEATASVDALLGRS